jgi:hypothetical protein
MATFWAIFCLANLLHFQLYKQIQNIVVGIVRFLKWFGVDIFDFQFELSYGYFGIFGLFFEKLGYFFQNFWSP